MADSFGIPQIVDYLTHMGLCIANVDQDQEIIELAFHGDNGQWRLIVNIQQSEEIRKLMFIVPHIGTVTTKKRLQCLEALLAVNYRIAMGKFGIDLEDVEVRLEEAIPLAGGSITFEQFQLALGAMMQTVAMYHGLLPRIVYGNLSVLEALSTCELEFLQEVEGTVQHNSATIDEAALLSEKEEGTEPEIAAELDVNDVLAEISRMLEERKE